MFRVLDIKQILENCRDDTNSVWSNWVRNYLIKSRNIWELKVNVSHKVCYKIVLIYIRPRCVVNSYNFLEVNMRSIAQNYYSADLEVNMKIKPQGLVSCK